jgi:hypothetical protein
MDVPGPISDIFGNVIASSPLKPGSFWKCVKFGYGIIYSEVSTEFIYAASFYNYSTSEEMWYEALFVTFYGWFGPYPNHSNCLSMHMRIWPED